MAEPITARIIRAPGRLITDPTSLDPDTHGGTVIGNVEGVYLMPFHDGFTVWAEEKAAPADVLEPHDDWAMGAFLRGWDDDAVGHVFGDTTVGLVSQHVRFRVPGTRLPGRKISQRSAKLFFLPDNPRDAPGVIGYVALPIIEASARIAFTYGTELGFPAVWRFVHDATERVIDVARVWDLEL